MSIDPDSKGKTLSAKKKSPDSQVPPDMQGQGYTAASPIETAGQSSTNSILNKAKEIRVHNRKRANSRRCVRWYSS